MKNLKITDKLNSLFRNHNFTLSKKSIASIILAASVATGAGHLISNHKVSTSNGETVGYTNVTPGFEFSIDGNDFLLLDVGSYKDFKMNKLIDEFKLKYTDKMDIANGLVISTDADTESEMLKEVLYLKSIMESHNTEYPVYLNIDKIVKNKNLDNQRKKDLILSFLNKCTANNMYVGMIGTDSNLKSVKENLEIEGYDAIVKKDNDSIEYDGSYNFYIENGKVYSITENNIEEAIKEKDLNNSNKFVGDATYVYHDGDSLDELAMNTGLSVNDILDYNNKKHLPSLYYDTDILKLVTDSFLKDGDILYIPSGNKKTIPLKNDSAYYERVEEPLRGADISSFNTITDWEQMSNDFDYLILRAGEGSTADTKFDSFAANAAANNIPIGLYVVNVADSRDSQEDIKKYVEKQAELAIKQASYKQIDYPIYIDLEYARTNEIKNEDLKLILETWYEKISAAGYVPGIYTSGNLVDKIHSSIDEELYNKYSLWYAFGENYATDMELSEVTPAAGKNLYSWDRDEVIMQQATSHAKGSAGGTGGGYIDVDFCKVDYSKPAEVDNYQEYPGVKMRDVSSNDVNFATLVCAGVIGVIAVKKKKLKKIR